MLFTHQQVQIAYYQNKNKKQVQIASSYAYLFNYCANEMINVQIPFIIYEYSHGGLAHGYNTLFAQPSYDRENKAQLVSKMSITVAAYMGST